MSKITQQIINRLPIKDKRYTVKLGNSLFVRMFPSGVKTYVLRYCAKGRVRDVTLGRLPMTVAQARARARSTSGRRYRAFNASSSNAIYSDSVSTVQQSAISSYILIKV